MKLIPQDALERLDRLEEQMVELVSSMQRMEALLEALVEIQQEALDRPFQV